MELTASHRARLHEWLGRWAVVADHSWPLQDTTVLEVESDVGRVIVKATVTSSHLHREVWAYRSQLAHLDDLVPRLIGGDTDAGILAIHMLAGHVVLGGAQELDATTWREAGQLLSRLMISHGWSESYMAEHIAKALGLIDRASELAPAHHLQLVAGQLEAMDPAPVPLVLTHGDYTARNWLRGDDGRFRAIDFGRAAARHWTSELPRLEHLSSGNPDLLDAFLGGLGRTPGREDAVVHRLEQIGMALGTIVWAHAIGDEEFEQDGRDMLARLAQ